MQEVNLTQVNNYYNAEQLYPIRPQQDINQLLADLFKSFSNLFDSLGNGQFNNPSDFPGFPFRNLIFAANLMIISLNCEKLIKNSGLIFATFEL